MSRSMQWPAELSRMMWRGLRLWWRAAAQTARLAIGLPDYDVYVSHMRRAHPDITPMSREAFFHERVAARYGRGRSRCC